MLSWLFAQDEVSSSSSDDDEPTPVTQVVSGSRHVELLQQFFPAIHHMASLATITVRISVADAQAGKLSPSISIARSGALPERGWLVSATVRGYNTLNMPVDTVWELAGASTPFVARRHQHETRLCEELHRNAVLCAHPEYTFSALEAAGFDRASLDNVVHRVDAHRILVPHTYPYASLLRRVTCMQALCHVDGLDARSQVDIVPYTPLVGTNHTVYTDPDRFDAAVDYIDHLSATLVPVSTAVTCAPLERGAWALPTDRTFIEATLNILVVWGVWGRVAPTAGEEMGVR